MTSKIDELEKEIDLALDRYKLKCCKTSKMGCCMNLIPVWSEDDLELIEKNKAKISELKSLHS